MWATTALVEHLSAMTVLAAPMLMLLAVHYVLHALHHSTAKELPLYASIALQTALCPAPRTIRVRHAMRLWDCGHIWVTQHALAHVLWVLS